LPTGWKEWDCGNIKGVGKFPEQLILPPGGEIWLLTTQRVLLNFWWPRFQDPMRRIIPEHLIDKTKNGGYKEKDRTVFLQRDSKIGCITYESGFDKAEGQRANVVIFDEEPPQEKMFHAGMQHGDMIMLIETPYRGITWSKDVVFPKTVSSDYSSFHATQYDSPYQGRAKIEARRKTMPKYEIKARIWGIASDIEGKPYYDYDKLSIWVQRYAAPQYTLATFDPQSDFRGIRGLQFDDQTFIPGLLETMIKRGKPSEPDGKATWCMYEDVIEGQAYLLLADPAEGAEDPEEAQDVCASMIMRPPIAEKEEDRPKIVASLRSTLPTIAFARVCSYAARYYNNSMLGAETMRHAVNAAFAAELRDWPYWYHMTVTNDKTKTAKTCMGFDPNSKTRFSIFELIGEWIDSFEACQYPGIPDYPLLVELMECVVGKHGRPDHTRNGTLDSTMCFGTGLHILKFSPEQVRCNGSNKQTLSVEEKRARWYGARHPKRQPDNCGLSMLGYKNGS
jgi:phage terminase large subunit-like protein